MGKLKNWGLNSCYRLKSFWNKNIFISVSRPSKTLVFVNIFVNLLSIHRFLINKKDNIKFSVTELTIMNHFYNGTCPIHFCLSILLSKWRNVFSRVSETLTFCYMSWCSFNNLNKLIGMLLFTLSPIIMNLFYWIFPPTQFILFEIPTTDVNSIWSN